MVFRLIGVIAVAVLVSGCNEEAGQMQDFPPIGGRSPVVLPPIAPPVDPAHEQDASNEEMTASLTNAVDAALGLTVENIEPIPVGPVPQVAIDPATGEAIASDSGVLNLSLSTQEEQRIAREADAAALQAAAAQRVIIEPGQMPEVLAGVNIVAYARSTSNAVGQRVVRRPTIRRRNNRSECARFASADDAQRNFLANGGPAEDPLNLDPDGDGFACNWSPEPYRALILD